MFMFVSGMVAGIPFDRNLSVGAPPLAFIRSLSRSFLRLIVPFFAWTIVSFYFQPGNQSLGEWLIRVIRQPDLTLWFLWILFQCHIVMTLIGIALTYIQRKIGKFNLLIPLSLGYAAVFSIQLIGKNIPSFSGLHLTQYLLPYFIFGMLYSISLPRGISPKYRTFVVLLFVILAPFWHRTEVSSLISYLPSNIHPRQYNLAFNYIVGFCGTLSFIELSRMAAARSPDFTSRAAAYVGRRSLDIYAIHFYWLGWFPPVIAPLLLSLCCSELLRSNPVTSRLFLGEWKGWLTFRPSKRAEVSPT